MQKVNITGLITQRAIFRDDPSLDFKDLVFRIFPPLLTDEFVPAMPACLDVYICNTIDDQYLFFPSRNAEYFSEWRLPCNS